MQHPAIGHDDAKSAVTFREMRSKVARSLMDIDEARVHLMPVTRGTFTGKGVKLLRPDTGQKRVFIEPVRYVSRHPLMTEWFVRAKNERAKHAIDFYDQEFRYDPYSPGVIYFRNPRDGELIPLDAKSDDRELLPECSYWDILHNIDQYAVYRHDAVEGRDQALSHMEAGQEQTKQDAQEAYDTELAGQEKKPSKSKLRGNKAKNREREDTLYQFGMPTQSLEISPHDGSSVASAEPRTESAGNPFKNPAATAPVAAAPPPAAQGRSSIFTNAIRSRQGREVAHVSK